ncbi:MAG: metallophosphoesterase family protein [Spirochaetota bacterium]
MKILHTSDLHLKEDCPERMEAAVHILKLAKKESVDLVVIAGDTFDSDVSANRLRGRLREMFSGNPFQIMIIPGNHDQLAFQENLEFGDDLEALVGIPFTVKDLPEVRIVGVPYFEGSTEQLVLELKNARAENKTNILVIHCTFDLPSFMQEDFGREDKPRYLPFARDVLAELGSNYILAGHFHSRFIKNPLTENCTFIYPGSPASVTRREQGKRSVNILDTEEGPRQVELNTFYYQTIRVVFNPFEEQKNLQLLEKDINSHLTENAQLEVVLDGFISSSEKDFRKNIDTITQGVEKVQRRYREVSDVLEDGLFKKFQVLLEKQQLEEQKKQKIMNTVIRVFSDLKAGERQT